MSKPRPKASALDPDEARVTLKPFLGLKPGTYLTILYALLLLGILFLVLFYPGLRSRGTFVRFATSPRGAAVLVDGDYRGSTPCEVLVKGGNHRITLNKPFYRSREFTEHFGGRVFATLVLPPRRSFEFHLELQEPEALYLHGLRDFTANPHIPQILSQIAREVSQTSPQEVAGLYDFLNKSKYFINTPLQLGELLLAFGLTEARGGVFSPATLLGIVDEFVQLKEKYENLPFWLLLALPSDTARRISPSPWLNAYYARYQERYRNYLSDQVNQGRILAAGRTYKLDGLVFRYIPPGMLIQGNYEEGNIHPLLPHPVRVESFWISDTEVPNALYRTFLEQNPYWRKANLETLLAEGKVTDSYLAAWEDRSFPPGAEALPVVNVSFYAAEAFSRWFNGRLGQEGLELSARLPYESEWEWAARGGLVAEPYPAGAGPGDAYFFRAGIQGPRTVAGGSPNGYGLRNMAGNVWEWCQDWYSPVKYLLSSWQANPVQTEIRIPLGHEKVVRGGSWANQKELVKVHTRGSQPPAWCTPYLGFRLLLAGSRE